MKLPIYMDHHATTPVDPRVLEAMLPYFTEDYGNAASCSHQFGWRAEGAVERARKQVAALIHAQPDEIVFTSGATESDNLAIKGVARARRRQGNRIVTVATEHPAVLDSCRRLEAEGFEVTYLVVESDGLLDLTRFADTLGKGAVLASVMTANNEIGVLQPIAEIGRLCRERGIPFHTDAVQAVGKVPVDVEAMSIDLLSISAHKMYGPKGVGALYVRKADPDICLAPILDGGGQERGVRSGTLNVPGIVGLGEACEIAQREMTRESVRLRSLRDRLKDDLFARLEGIQVNGSMDRRLPHNLNLSFAGVDGESLLMALEGIAVSSGSACHSSGGAPSHVLQALGVSPELAEASLRFGLGRSNTAEEIEYVIERVVEAVTSVRNVSFARKEPSGKARE